MQATQELPIRDMSPLLAPRALKAELPMTEVAHRTVVEGRATVRRILRREDLRLFLLLADVVPANAYGRAYGSNAPWTTSAQSSARCSGPWCHFYCGA